MPAQVLLLDEDRYVLSALASALTKAGLKVHVCTKPADALEEIAAHRIEVLIAEFELPGLSRSEFLRQLRAKSPETVVVAYTGNMTAEAAIEATRLNVFDWKVKPTSLAVLVEVVRKALAHRALLLPQPILATPPLGPAATANVVEDSSPTTLATAIERHERTVIEGALNRHDWNRQLAAAELGINRITLYKKMRKLGMDGPA